MALWPRYPLPCSRGYNYCGEEELTFQVVYDAENDRLTITASQPVFTDIDSISFQGSGGNGSTSAISAIDPSIVEINGAYAELLGPTTITQLDFYNVGPALIGTWVGSVPLAAPIFIAVLDVTSAMWDVVNGPDFISDGICQTRTQDGGIFQNVIVAQVDGDTTLVGGAIATYVDASTLEIREGDAGDYVFDLEDGTMIFWSNDLPANEVAELQLLDLSGTPIGANFIMPTAIKFGAFNGGTISEGVIDFTFAPMSTGSLEDFGSLGIDSYVRINLCEDGDTGGEIIAYNPNGPQAGLNNPAYDIITWTNTAVHIENVVDMIYPPVILVTGIVASNTYTVDNIVGDPV